MVRSSAPRSATDEAGREARLKPILMAVALILVAGYALGVTEMGALTLDRAGALLNSDFALLLIGGTGALVAIGGLAYLVLRGRLSLPSSEKEAKPVDLDALPGRRELLAALDAEIARHRKSGRQVALYVVDFDRFRLINQQRGESEGDDFLRLAAERLLQLVNRPDRLARIGDDEFAIVQADVGGARHTELFARRIQDTLKDVCAQVPRQERPGVSIGIAIAPDQADSGAKLLHAASLALDVAKQAGDTFEIYSREMEIAVEARRQMEKAIGDGLHQGWFELRFQPQYDLRTRRLTGFEALVRMNHPERGELQPSEFLPIASECGLIQPLGEWIVRDALATAAEWPAHIGLSLNISLAQLQHGDIANVVQHALVNAGVSGSRVRLEVPEMVLGHSPSVTEQIRRLKGRGIMIVFDDFGGDATRLGALAAGIGDAVKLDRSLVEKLGVEAETESLLRGLVATARAFDLDVLAEGVERPEQAHFLMMNGCEKVQGYLFGRPARKSELAAIVAKDLRNSLEEGRLDATPAAA